jgi:undecaprenyl-diphosphatase
VISSALLVALGLLAFVLLAGAVQWGGTQQVDEWILEQVRQLALRDPATGRIWGEESVIAITSMGTLVILVILSCAVLGLLLLTRRTQAALLLALALLGAIGLNYGLKSLFGRDRPTVVPRLQRVDSKSFPSGHALVSTSVYAALGAIGANLLRERRLKIYIAALSVLVSIAIGLSRVYLGVHYPSDVLAGWTVGFVWALICWKATRYLQDRGILERAR